MKTFLASTLLILARQAVPGHAQETSGDSLNTATLLAQAQDPAATGSASAAAAPAAAPAATPPATEGAFAADQLEQLVAPIALYPDALLSQILMASTYPLEVVEANRFMEKNPELKGEALDKQLLEQEWDPSVKGLCTVPNVLKQMSDNLDWTQDLGDAFLGQKVEVMDTVQRMRGKAYEAGNLKSSPEQAVTQKEDKIIVIESSDPEVIYVPTYSSTVVYGSWGYPSYYYPPMYPYYPPGYGLVSFGVGVAVGAAIWGGCNWGWGGSDVDIDINRNTEFNRNTNINADRTNISNRQGAGNREGKGSWQHDSNHRKGVNYRDNKTAQQFGGGTNSNRVSRDQARGHSTNRASGTRPSAGTSQAGNRGGQQARTPQQSNRSGASASNRSGAAASNRSSSGRSNSAYSGSRNASSDRMSSSRGASSRGSTSFGGSRGGGMSRGGGGRRR